MITSSKSLIIGFLSVGSAERVSLRLEAGQLYHLGPLLDFVGDQLSELSRRSGSAEARRAIILGSSRAGLTCLLRPDYWVLLPR